MGSQAFEKRPTDFQFSTSVNSFKVFKARQILFEESSIYREKHILKHRKSNIKMAKTITFLASKIDNCEANNSGHR